MPHQQQPGSCSAPEAGDLASELHLYSTKAQLMRENLGIWSVLFKVLKENWSLDSVLAVAVSHMNVMVDEAFGAVPSL